MSATKSILFLILVVLGGACASAPQPNAQIMTETSKSTPSLSQVLLKNGYGGLFLLGSETLADSIWAEGERKKELLKLFRNGAEEAGVRFLAAEILRQHGALPTDSPELIADLYTQALSSVPDEAGNPLMLNGNAFGLLLPEDDPGELGKVIIEQDEAAVPYLLPLLENPQELWYEGSEEATLGAMYQLRIKDAAAYYLSKISGFPLEHHKAHEDRDAAIAELKKKLEK